MGGHVAKMEEGTSAFKLFAGESTGRNIQKGVDGRTIL